MGRVTRNMVGIITVLVWGLAAAWLGIAQHFVAAVVVLAFALLRLWVLLRDWGKSGRR
jgi:hypothetical protein